MNDNNNNGNDNGGGTLPGLGPGSGGNTSPAPAGNPAGTGNDSSRSSGNVSGGSPAGSDSGTQNASTSGNADRSGSTTTGPNSGKPTPARPGGGSGSGTGKPAGGSTGTGKSTGGRPPKQPPVVALPLSVGLTDAEAPAKNKGGRPPSKAKVARDSVADALEAGSAFLAAGLGPHWKMSDQEILKIAEPAARCLERLPIMEVAAEYADPAALIFALLVVIGPRLMTELNKQKAPAPRRAGAKREEVKTENEQVGSSESESGGDGLGSSGDPYDPARFVV